jgi:hypothetical protein
MAHSSVRCAALLLFAVAAVASTSSAAHAQGEPDPTPPAEPATPATPPPPPTPPPATPVTPPPPEPPPAQTAQPTEAQPVAPAPAEEEAGSRTLGGHTYLFAPFQPAPFIATYFSLQQGLQATTASDVPFGRLGNVDLATVFVLERAQLGVKITDWLGITGDFEGNFSTGVNVKSLLIRGGEYSYGGGGGLVGRIVRIDKTNTQVTARAGVTYLGGQIITIAPLLDALVKTPRQAVEDIVSGDIGNLVLVPGKFVTVPISIDAAQTISPNFSAQLSVGFRYRQTTVSPFDTATNTTRDFQLTTTSPNVALALTADGAPNKIPVAVVGEIAVQFPRTKNEQTGRSQGRVQPTLALGLYYSGQRHLQLGLVGALGLGLEPIQGRDAGGNAVESKKPTSVSGLFDFRYVW